jgi:hypothetical protein
MALGLSHQPGLNRIPNLFGRRGVRKPDMQAQTARAITCIR